MRAPFEQLPLSEILQDALGRLVETRMVQARVSDVDSSALERNDSRELFEHRFQSECH